jgi:hypothetical protein
MSADNNRKQFSSGIAVVTVVMFSSTIIKPALAQGNQRPLSDFLNAQGTTTCFTPPAPAQLGWGTGPGKTNGQANLTPPRFALIDYAGLEAKYLLDHGMNIGTTISGTVTERNLADGHALVRVDLHTKNALGWAIQDPSDLNADPLVFGARVLDVLAGKIPALGNSHVIFEFINSAPGAPLPDMVGISYDPVACPTVVPFPIANVVSFSIQASITGILHAPALPNPVSWPEGATGRLDVVQIVPFHAAIQNGGKGPLFDSASVEAISLKPIGN